MRLIDADDAIRKMESVMDMQELYLPIHFKECVIDECHTIDAVPVKHGKWNPHPFEKEWDVCSSCGTGCMRREREFNHLGQKSVTEYNYQYCPWCGAKMDGGRTDEQT